MNLDFTAIFDVSRGVAKHETFSASFFTSFGRRKLPEFKNLLGLLSDSAYNCFLCIKRQSVPNVNIISEHENENSFVDRFYCFLSHA